MLKGRGDRARPGALDDLGHRRSPALGGADLPGGGLVCAGAGGSVLAPRAADVYWTGEMRHHDVLAALAGTGFIFGLLAMFLVLQLDPQQPKPGLALAYLGLFVWSLMVDGHIYRHALSIKMSLGVLVAVLIFAANYTLMRAIFG